MPPFNELFSFNKTGREGERGVEERRERRMYEKERVRGRKRESGENMCGGRERAGERGREREREGERGREREREGERGRERDK